MNEPIKHGTSRSELDISLGMRGAHNLEAQFLKLDVGIALNGKSLD